MAIAQFPFFPCLQDKFFFLTGGTRGIGKNVAEGLAHHGCHLILTYRHESTFLAQKDFLLSSGAKSVRGILCDFSPSQLYKTQELIQQELKSLSSLDGAILNAGIAQDKLILRANQEHIEQIMATNLHAPIFLSGILSRYLMKSSNSSLIFMSSVVGMMGNTSQSVYAASKAGLIGLSKSLAKELSSRNVRCNVIAPGFIETEMTENLSEEAKTHYSQSIPLKRFGHSQDVTALVLFLLSSYSSYITGEIFKVDGGLYI